ncbi:MAG: thioredoxin domain-containing protein, partial [Chloroflexota bacterium]
MSNKLAGENSPYLLQHADNPVAWFPWGEEALGLAREQDKPILLSIGYAACHWCHVMAHESFENEATAALMNRYFVNIKVDREERPDLDSIYMGAIQALNGQGGWPLTAFLTPEGEPFYGGTYYPPVPRYGMPSFTQVLESVADAWQTRREEIENSAAGIAAHLSQAAAAASTQAGQAANEALFDQALQVILGQFDSEEGGFSRAPKFPPSMTIEFLLRMVMQREEKMARQMAVFTLDKMAKSGMYDQLGGGFARYATDNKWLVPHFEKMLYDNALLARAYLHAYQVTGDALYRRIVEETLDFVAREMRHEEGGFYSSYDADSEGVEGKFYVWQADEIREVLGKDAELFMARYGVSDEGNWEGENILHIATEITQLAERFGLTEGEIDERLATAKERLYAVRAERVWPGLDDKVLTAWNGLMLAAFAEAGRVLERADYVQIAEENAEFLARNMQTENGRLQRTWKAGSRAKYNGYLEDYAYLADGLLA